MKSLLCAVCVTFATSHALPAAEPEWKPLLDGNDFSGWINVNGAPETWTIKDGVVACTGKPTGALRTVRQFENFELELEWRHMKSGGNAGIFVWASPLPAVGQPFLRAIEVQVLDNGYNEKGKNEFYTTHGDVFPIHGATMTPMRPQTHKGDRCFPSEERSKSSPEWNHYRIVANNGSIRLSVNGKEVSGGDNCNWRKGHLGLESEGSPTEWRHIKIKELPDTGATPEQSAPLDEGWRVLYNGVDLRGWKATGKAVEFWKPEDWRLKYVPSGGDTAAVASGFETTETFANVDLRFDWRVDEPDAAKEGVGGLVFGNANMFAPLAQRISNGLVLIDDAASPPGRWNTYAISRRGENLTVSLNGKPILQNAKRLRATAPVPVGFETGDKSFEIANLFLRDVK